MEVLMGESKVFISSFFWAAGEKKIDFFFFFHNSDLVAGDESMYEGKRSVGFCSNWCDKVPEVTSKGYFTELKAASTPVFSLHLERF